MNILLLVGLAIFFGTFGGKIFQKLKIPQVVGYIIIGVLFGESLLGFWSPVIIDSLRSVVCLSLADATTSIVQEQPV